MWQSQRFKELDLVNEVEVGELLPLRVQDRSAGVGIDDAAQIRPRLCFEEDVLPVVAQLPLVLASNEEGWAGATLAPLLAAMRRNSASDRRNPLVLRSLPLRNLTSQMPCGFLGSPPLRISSIKKVLARGTVSRASRAHLCVICEGHITSVVLGRPSASTWIVPSAIYVLPAPHSATIRAALALRKYLAVPVIASACAGSAFRRSAEMRGATGSFVP